MYTRGLGLGVVMMVSVLGAAGCGGDDTGTATNMAAATCNPVMQPKSMPHTPTDPCPQNEPQCPYPMYTAVTTCMPDAPGAQTGRWNPQCSCVLTSSLQGQGGAQAPATGNCGNNMVEPALGEQCDPGVPVAMTCAQMMPGTTGMITCNPSGSPTACTLNTSMCMAMQTPPAGGQGG